MNGSMLKAKGRREKRFGKGQMKAKKGRKKRKGQRASLPENSITEQSVWMSASLPFGGEISSGLSMWPRPRNLRIDSASWVVRQDGYHQNKTCSKLRCPFIINYCAEYVL